MSLDLHRLAEALMARGDAAAAAGDRTTARHRYREAASAEAEAFALIPTERTRTRGIIAVSTVALFRRAEAYEEAIRYAHRYLGLDDLPDFSRDELEDLLDTARNEREVFASGRKVTKEGIEWVMRGPGVGNGTAPLGTVIRKAEQIEKFGLRVFEYLTGATVRVSGPPDERTREAFEMLIAEPVSGSFRFRVRFATPVGQLPLFPDHDIPDPERVSEVASAILLGVQNPESKQFRDVVTDDEYRQVFISLVRSMLPDGKEVSEIEALNLSSTAPSRVLLTPGLRPQLSSGLARLKPVPSNELFELRGTLRALDLNRKWVKLGSKDNETTCHVGETIILEDVVGPLVNQPVLVRCRYGKKGHLFIQDIEPDTGEDPLRNGLG